MSHLLTSGSIVKIAQNDTSIIPTLQVLDVKKIVTGTTGERYRLVLSDGSYYMQAILTTKCQKLVTEGLLKKYAIIDLTEFSCSNVSCKKICVIIDCNVNQQLQGKLGDPQNVRNINDQHRNQLKSPAISAKKYISEQKNDYQNFDSHQIQPISSLHPYQQSWKIRVRCTMKDDLKHYSNQKGEGKLFGVDLLDRDGSEIRAVAFNQAADKFYNIFQKDGVYLISNGQIRLARKGYSHIKNDYSITLNQDADVIPINDKDNDIQKQKYEFIQIKQIQKVEPKSFVDVIGVVIDISEIQSIISSRTQKRINKRNLKIADPTAQIDITLWNEDVEKFSTEQLKGAVVAFKGCKVSDYGGRSLSAQRYIELNPKEKAANNLMAWLRNHEDDTTKLNLTDLTTRSSGNDFDSPRRTFAEIEAMELGKKIGSKQNKNEADYFSVVATITTIVPNENRKPWYEANPDQNSDAKNCKVTSTGTGKWRCEKNGQVYDHYTPRYILRFCASDFSGNHWLTAYDKAASKILTKTASEAEELFNNDREKYLSIFQKVQFNKYVFRCRAWSDIWEDSQRVRIDVLDAELANPKIESQKLIEKIEILRLKNKSN